MEFDYNGNGKCAPWLAREESKYPGENSCKSPLKMAPQGYTFYPKDLCTTAIGELKFESPNHLQKFCKIRIILFETIPTKPRKDLG